MKKLVLYAIGNDEDGGYNHFEIEKTQRFEKFLFELLKKCGIDHDLFDVKGDLPDIKECTDFNEHYRNEEFDIDVFYGLKKIILVVRTKKREELMKTIMEYCEFYKNKPKVK